MLKVNSTRAKNILENPRHLKREVTSAMRKFPGSSVSLWVGIEGEDGIVKNLSFSGALEKVHILILESMASLLIGRKITVLDGLSIRECEAYLRDRNSEISFEFEDKEIEKLFISIFQWIRTWPFPAKSGPYMFERTKGEFRSLALVDKVREIKAFLASEEVIGLYSHLRLPQLIDVEDLTVYVDAPYSSEAERALFDELHEFGVRVFRESELNFIPEH